VKRPSLVPKKIPAWAWKRLKAPARKPQAGPRKLPRWFWAWRKWRLSPAPKPAPAPAHEITMFDDVNLDLIPAKAEAVAGYVNGRWPTFPEVVRRWADSKHLSIAVTASADAECLDIERGDAEVFQAPEWFVRQRKRGVARPAFYISVSEAAGLEAELARNGVKRSAYRLITAHYTGVAHRCTSECGFGFKDKADATQWTDKALGRSLDETLCAPDFFA